MLLIGPTAFLPALRARVDDAEAVCASDVDASRALELIDRHRPAVIVFERIFAMTPRGAALMNELMQNPALEGIELRVMAHDEDYMRVVRRGTGPSAAPAQPVRRTERRPIRDGLAVQIDGKPVVILDLSGGGAKVISETVLRPNQVVRLSIAVGDRTLRFTATIAWSAFEMSKETGRTHYRAGVTFSEADATAIELACREVSS